MRRRGEQQTAKTTHDEPKKKKTEKKGRGRGWRQENHPAGNVVAVPPAVVLSLVGKRERGGQVRSGKVRSGQERSGQAR
jgi:hypothetical protein